MLKLNIIPLELKNEKKLKALLMSLKVLCAISIVLFSLYTIVLLGAKFILQLHFINVMDSTSISAGSRKSTDKNIREINDQIKSIANIQENNTRWSYLIEYLSNNAGTGIKYEKIEINKTNETIEIEGFADKRNDLIRFKDAMEKSGYFESIKLPIKNLLKKTNLTFNISAKINNYGFIGS